MQCTYYDAADDYSQSDSTEIYKGGEAKHPSISVEEIEHDSIDDKRYQQSIRHRPEMAGKSISTPLKVISKKTWEEDAQAIDS